MRTCIRIQQSGTRTETSPALHSQLQKSHSMDARVRGNDAGTPLRLHLTESHEMLIEAALFMKSAARDGRG